MCSSTFPSFLILQINIFRYWDDFDGEYKINVMNWFINKVREKAPEDIIRRFQLTSKTGRPT